MPTSSTYVPPEEAAAAVLERTWSFPGTWLTLPVDPIAVARGLGIDVYTATLPDGVDGMLEKKAGGRPAIYLNREIGEARKKFTCAHEIGHFVRRQPQQNEELEYVDRRDPRAATGTHAEEVYANQFAAALLMPRSEVEQALRNGVRSLPRLAKWFGVSEQAMDLRLRNLQLRLT